MPRDDWVRARARDIARRAELRNNRSAVRSAYRSKGRKKARKHQDRLQSMATVLWFGKHKGCTVQEVLHDNPNYLTWLVAQPIKTNSWRLRILVPFLRKLLSDRARHSPRIGHPALAAVLRGNEAPVTSIEGQGKLVARTLGPSAKACPTTDCRTTP